MLLFAFTASFNCIIIIHITIILCSSLANTMAISSHNVHLKLAFYMDWQHVLHHDVVDIQFLKKAVPVGGDECEY